MTALLRRGGSTRPYPPSFFTMPLAPIAARSLRTQIAVVFAVLTAATAMLLSFGFGEWLSRQGEREAGRSLQLAARTATLALGQGLADRASQAKVIAGAEDVWNKGLTSLEARALIVRAKTLQRQSVWVGVADESGTVMAASGGLLEQRDVSDRAWFQQGKAGLYVGDVHPAKLLESLLPPLPGGEPLRFIDFAAPIVVGGRRIGVLGMHGSWLWADDVMESLLPPAADRHGLELFVFDRAGALIYAPGKPDRLKNASQTFAPLLDTRQKPRAVLWADGALSLTASAPLPTQPGLVDLGWQVVARQPLAEAYASSRALVWRAVAAGLIVALLAALISWRLARRLSEDLQALAVAAQRMKVRGANHDIPALQSSREVRQLSSALSDMTKSLLQAQTDLEGQVQERTHQLELANAELDRQARTDALTGLLNRRGLDTQFDLLMALAERTLRPLAVITFDVDYFKRVNDEYGHAVGDAVLQRLALRLRQALRASDVLARVGGEEFVALCPDTDASGAKALAQKLVDEVHRTSDPDVGSITISAGASSLRGERDGRTALMRRSDGALYAAKESGRNRVCVEY